MAYEFWCRTPLTIDVYGQILDIRFKAAAGGAGQNGEKLQPGEGAWVDRALRQGEPASIQVAFRGSNQALSYGLAERDVLLESTLLRTALMTPDTLIRFHLENEGGRVLYSHSGCRSPDPGVWPYRIAPARR